jgi:ribosomal protein S19E (S16A)
MLSDWRVLTFEAEVPSGEVLPSPAEAFRRLVHTALLKLPFFLKPGEEGIEGDLPIAITAAPTDAIESVPPPAGDAPGHKLAGLFPLPGGVRRYHLTLNEILAWLDGDDAGRSADEIAQMFAERYEASGVTATRGYVQLLVSLGFVEQRGDGGATLTEVAHAYLTDPSADVVFERMNQAFEGIVATLALVAEVEPAKPSTIKIVLNELLQKEWKTGNQSSFRANWLLSLGMTERSPKGDVLTDRGRATLARYPEAAALRAEVANIVAEQPDLVAEDDDADLPEATGGRGHRGRAHRRHTGRRDGGAGKLERGPPRSHRRPHRRAPRPAASPACRDRAGVRRALVGQASSARRTARNGEDRAGRRPRAGRAERALLARCLRGDGVGGLDDVRHDRRVHAPSRQLARVPRRRVLAGDRAVAVAHHRRAEPR